MRLGAGSWPRGRVGAADRVTWLSGVSTPVLHPSIGWVFSRGERCCRGSAGGGVTQVVNALIAAPSRPCADLRLLVRSPARTGLVDFERRDVPLATSPYGFERAGEAPSCSFRSRQVRTRSVRRRDARAGCSRRPIAARNGHRGMRPGVLDPPRGRATRPARRSRRAAPRAQQDDLARPPQVHKEQSRQCDPDAVRPGPDPRTRAR